MSTLSGSSAIYLQIQKHFETEIAAGRMAPGSKIDSIRALAVTYKVNPNTIQKSLQELERSGLIYTDRTNGKFVTEDKVIIKELNVKLAKSLIGSFVVESKKLGFTLKEIEKLLEEAWESNDDRID